MSSKKIRKSKHLLATLVTDNRAPCAFCQRNVDDEVTYGKLYAIGDIQCHYFCALLSCCLIQKGKDTEGLFGFLYDDILAEIERSKKHKCSFCREGGATLGCSVRECRRQFHLPCGRERGAISLFYGNFKSFCREHAPKQRLPEHITVNVRARQKYARGLSRSKRASIQDGACLENKGPVEAPAECVCVICYEAVDGLPSTQTFWPPCCARDAWFHRSCLQRMALTAGMHYLKCPLCNDKDTFYDAVINQGYYVPDRDAAWELEQNAFAEIYERPLACSAIDCRCPNGREHDDDRGPWDIKLCILCGTTGIHLECHNNSNLHDKTETENNSDLPNNSGIPGNNDLENNSGLKDDNIIAHSKDSDDNNSLKNNESPRVCELKDQKTASIFSDVQGNLSNGDVSIGNSEIKYNIDSQGNKESNCDFQGNKSSKGSTYSGNCQISYNSDLLSNREMNDNTDLEGNRESKTHCDSLGNKESINNSDSICKKVSYDSQGDKDSNVNRGNTESCDDCNLSSHRQFNGNRVSRSKSLGTNDSRDNNGSIHVADSRGNGDTHSNCISRRNSESIGNNDSQSNNETRSNSVCRSYNNTRGNSVCRSNSESIGNNKSRENSITQSNNESQGNGLPESNNDSQCNSGYQSNCDAKLNNDCRGNGENNTNTDSQSYNTSQGNSVSLNNNNSRGNSDNSDKTNSQSTNTSQGNSVSLNNNDLRGNSENNDNTDSQNNNTSQGNSVTLNNNDSRGNSDSTLNSDSHGNRDSTLNSDSRGNSDNKDVIRFVCTVCKPAAPKDIDSLAATLDKLIQAEQSERRSTSRHGPVMPSRMSLRRTKQRAEHMPSTSQTSMLPRKGALSEENQNTPLNRSDLNLKTPKRQCKVQTSQEKHSNVPTAAILKNIENKLLSPIKMLEQSLYEKMQCTGVSGINVYTQDVIERVRDKFKKPRPLREKKRILNEILETLLDNKESPKIKDQLIAWSSPKKTSVASDAVFQIATSEKRRNAENLFEGLVLKKDNLDESAREKNKTDNKDIITGNNENLDEELSTGPKKAFEKDVSLNKSTNKGVIHDNNDINNTLSPETSKLRMIDIEKDSSLEISENDDVINIDVLKIKSCDANESDLLDFDAKSTPKSNEKCLIKFNPVNKEILKIDKIDFDLESFKKHYLNEIAKNSTTGICDNVINTDEAGNYVKIDKNDRDIKENGVIVDDITVNDKDASVFIDNCIKEVKEATSKNKNTVNDTADENNDSSKNNYKRKSQNEKRKDRLRLKRTTNETKRTDNKKNVTVRKDKNKRNANVTKDKRNSSVTKEEVVKKDRNRNTRRKDKERTKKDSNRNQRKFLRTKKSDKNADKEIKKPNSEENNTVNLKKYKNKNSKDTKESSRNDEQNRRGLKRKLKIDDEVPNKKVRIKKYVLKYKIKGTADIELMRLKKDSKSTDNEQNLNSESSKTHSKKKKRKHSSYDGKLKIRFREERVRMKIERKKKKIKSDIQKELETKHLRQCILNFNSDETSFLTTPDKDVSPLIKKKHVKIEKSPDNLKQTSIASFFKIKVVET